MEGGGARDARIEGHEHAIAAKSGFDEIIDAIDTTSIFNEFRHRS
jgi:hypothetical protein